MSKAVGLVLVVVLTPTGATAHTLDEYVQATRLSLTRTHVSLDIDLTPGAQVAAPIIEVIDGDRDGLITPVEASAYGARLLADIAVELNGEPVAMTLTRIEVPPVGEMRDGMGMIGVNATGAHHARLLSDAVLSFRNNHAPDISVYAVNALVPTDRTLSVARQDRDVQQRSVQVSYDVRSGLLLQIGWIVFAAVTSVGWVLFRKRDKTPPQSLNRRAGG